MITDHPMSTRTKNLPRILLILSLVCFVAGIVEGMRPGGWGLGIPFGAVLFGLFIVVRVMQKESARFDEEQRAREENAERAEGKESTRVGH